MKKTILITMVSIMLFTTIFAGCGKNKKSSETGPETTLKAETETITKEQQDESTKNPTKDEPTKDKPTEASTEKETTGEEPTTEEKESQPTKNPSKDEISTETPTKGTTEETKKPTKEPTKEPTEASTEKETTGEEPTTEETKKPTKEPTTEPETTVDYGTGTITVWVPEEIQEVVQMNANEFIDSNKSYSGYNVKVEAVSQADAIGNVMSDIENAADIYLFVYDQYVRLINANYLTEIKGSYREYIEKNNGDDAVAVSKINNSIYAYPATLTNGYFLYYDKSVISNPNSLEQMIADCEAAGKNYYFNTSNGWYQPAFFLATGCYFKSELNDDYTTTDTTNVASQQGIVALREMAELRDSEYFVDSQSSPFENPGFIVTGSWEETNIRNILGNNFEVAKLPEFVGSDGKTYQMSSFTGYNLYGIKPQEHSGKEEVCKLLLNYLTSADVQLDIFKTDRGYGPVNKEARNNSVFTSDKICKALMEQSKYSVPQGLVPMGVWNGCGMCSIDATDKEVLRRLQSFQCNITGEELPEEEYIEDGLREELVAAAIAARKKYMAENLLEEIPMETGAFYDFNLDGVPEYCLMNANAYFNSSGNVYEYVDGEYVLKGSLTNYDSMETYKDTNGNMYNISYRYYRSSQNHITSEKVFADEMNICEYKFWNFTQEYFIGTAFEPSPYNDVDSAVYYDAYNKEITKEEFDANIESYIQGMTKLRYCGGFWQQIGNDVEENINNAYISYLQKKNYR